MNNTTFKEHFKYAGMGYFVQKSFDPSKIKDPYLREVVIKTRAYYLEGTKRVNAHLKIKKEEE